MLLNKKPGDVVGLDTLAKNIISAKFPDNNDELFYTNEFLDLNQVSDPDMGLNFQARKA